MTRLALVLGFVLCSLRWLLPPWTCNHDVAWFLHVADRFLGGSQLYVDIVDLNPPLIVYLSALPVATARAIGTSEILTFHVFVLIAAAASLTLAGRVLSRVDLFRTPLQRAVGMLALLYVLIVLPEGDFGQREHLLVIALVPWLCVAVARICSRRVPARLALTAGLMAGIGLCLKPHFTLGPALVVAWMWTRIGWRNLITAENATVATVLASYIAHFFFLPADVTSGLIEVFDTARATYAGYDATLGALVTEPLILECALLGGAALLLPVRGDARAAGAILGWIWAGTLAAALWQHKGWSYHFLPAAAAGRVLLAVVALAALQQRSRAWGAVLGTALTALIAFALVERHDGGVRWTKPHRDWLAHADELRRHAAGGPVLVLDTDIAPHFPALVHAGLQPTSRFACLWPLPGLAHADEREGIEHRLRTALIEDIERRPPRLVIIARPPVPLMERDFDLLAWLRRDQRFDSFWRGLEAVDTSGRWSFHRRQR